MQMKRIERFLVSMPFTGFLLLVLAVAMAVATLVETAWGTAAAKALIYQAHWFEVVFVLLGISLVANFFRYRQYTRRKLTVGIFHLAFILIVLGAGITRYVSFEGMMHIREGERSNTIISADRYLNINVDGTQIRRKVLFSVFTSGQVNEKVDVGGENIRVKSVEYFPNAVRMPVEHPSGSPVVDLVVSVGQGMQGVSFQEGDQINLGAATLGFEADADIRFSQQDGQLYLETDRELEIRSMGGGESAPVVAGSRLAVQPMRLYALDQHVFLVKKFYPHALLQASPDPSGNSQEDAVVLEVSDGHHHEQVSVFGRSGQEGVPVSLRVGEKQLTLTYGSEPVQLPFSLQLKDFQLERYIGSESPSSFASEIKLIDGERNVERDVRIFMNNTLKYRAYRFYQSSYDQDEQGTILSVNKDYWGTLITYIGYFLMTIGMVLSLFNKQAHFRHLVRRLEELNKLKVAVVLGVALLLSAQAQGAGTHPEGLPVLDKELVGDFSRLWVHGHDGRIEPMSTLSNEILRKISRRSSFEGRSADEVVLSMNLYPELWRTVPLIKVEKGVAGVLGISGKYASVLDFFDANGQYRMLEHVQRAYNKMPGMRNQLDKEFIYVDERLNISFMVFNGRFFSFFPTADTDEAWYAAGSRPTGYSSADSLFVNRSFQLLKKSFETGSDVQPREIMAKIADFQETFGSGILPSAQKKTAEILYNRFQPFKRIFPGYLLLGFVLLVILFVHIFRMKPLHKAVSLTFSSLILLIFSVHTVGLAWRWYISGHAPWSNGYESMVYVAWAAMLAGFIFGRKYPLVLGAASFLSGLTLFVAHLNWMNPEITHLVPVLKSYWLIIHVAVITASYGFIGLSAFLGLLVLVLYALLKEQNRENAVHFIRQLTTINELSVTLGLYLLTIGTFLGGVWANESWGRYWGWDPKETWALVTVLVYAFVAHMRLIPQLKGMLHFNMATVIAFSSVLMTYFGVNYFLSGMHSYGKGSVEGVHWSAYLAGLLIVLLMFLSYSKDKKFGISGPK